MDKIEEILRAERELACVRHKFRFHDAPDGGIHPSQFPILAELDKNDGCTQRELSERLSVAPPTVAVSMKRLESAGFVTRETDSADARNTRVYITESGRAAAANALKNIWHSAQIQFSGFSEEELDGMLGYLRRMRDSLEKYSDGWEKTE